MSQNQKSGKETTLHHDLGKVNVVLMKADVDTRHTIIVTVSGGQYKISEVVPYDSVKEYKTGKIEHCICEVYLSKDGSYDRLEKIQAKFDPKSRRRNCSVAIIVNDPNYVTAANHNPRHDVIDPWRNA